MQNMNEYESENKTNNEKRTRAKFLVDFDGVWTDVTGQALAVNKARVEQLTIISGLERSFIEHCLRIVQERIMCNPELFGWHSDGRISAFADEDPFLLHNATVEGIGIVEDSDCFKLKNSLQDKGIYDLSKMGSDIFQIACDNYLAEKSGHSLLSDSVSTLQTLTDLVDLVICTNFTTDLVAKTLCKYDFFSKIRLRGLARKNVLTGGKTGRAVSFGSRSVWIDRDHYMAALLEEKPDVVVGDVFSLDLALPLTLQRENKDFEHLHAYFMVTKYSSNWSKDLAQKKQVPQLHAITNPKELIEIAKLF